MKKLQKKKKMKIIKQMSNNIKRNHRNLKKCTFKNKIIPKNYKNISLKMNNKTKIPNFQLHNNNL